MELVEHRYSDKQPRFYIDGKRISAEKWEWTHIMANLKDKQLSCFHTVAKPYGIGCFHRINYSSIN